MTEWISVEHKLPDTDRKVLIFAYGEVMTGCCDDGQWYSDSDYNFCDEKSIAQLTYWAELPEPPRENQ